MSDSKETINSWHVSSFGWSAGLWAGAQDEDQEGSTEQAEGERPVTDAPLPVPRSRALSTLPRSWAGTQAAAEEDDAARAARAAVHSTEQFRSGAEKCRPHFLPREIPEQRGRGCHD